MSRSLKKAQRLLQIEHLLLAHPDGLRQVDLARKLNKHRSTISRDIRELSQTLPLWEDDEGRLGIDRDSYLTRVRLSIHECLALHLATRLMAAGTDRHNPHAAAAVRKLGAALERFAPLVSDHLRSTADLMDDGGRRKDARFIEVLETLTRAWSEACMVELRYQSEPERQSTYRLAPYFIEPYAAGRTVYTIGRLHPVDDVRLLKVGRIREIRLLEDRPYVIPEDFDPREMMRSAWGVWLSDAEPQQVVLRFDPSIAHRVRETQWHPSEELRQGDDGHLIWCAQVSEWTEMLPWIQGWGALVEVLEPPALREHVRAQAARMMQLYDERAGAG